MRWWFLVAAMAVAASALAVSSPRRCAGRLARERLKAAEKIRDKRYFQLCCTPACGPLYRKPRPPPARRYQPFHRTWLGLKYGTSFELCIISIWFIFGVRDLWHAICMPIYDTFV